MSGTECQTVDNALLSVSRGLEEIEWWSVYKLGSGARLSNTYVPLVKFPIARETLKMRYAGLEIPPDDAADARLKAPNVAGVITYASSERVLREALITAGDPKPARQLRSFADETRYLTLAGTDTAPISATIPIALDDLDLAHVEAPAHIRITALKR